MDLKRYQEPPKFICPVCNKNFEQPRERMRCLCSPQGFSCPCEQKVKLRMGSNYWYALVAGCSLLLIGGRLWSAQLPILLPLFFLAVGTGTLFWGIYNSRLEQVEAQTKSPPPGKQR